MIKSFPVFDMLIRSGDIRDQIESCQKWRKILGDFSGGHKFLGAGNRALQKLYPIYHPRLAGRRLKKVP